MWVRVYVCGGSVRTYVCYLCCLLPSYLLVPSRSLLEKQGIDFIKTQEEELEKEFEEMRVSGCSVLATVHTYVHTYCIVLYTYLRIIYTSMPCSIWGVAYVCTYVRTYVHHGVSHSNEKSFCKCTNIYIITVGHEFTYSSQITS